MSNKQHDIYLEQRLENFIEAIDDAIEAFDEVLKSLEAFDDNDLSISEGIEKWQIKRHRRRLSYIKDFSILSFQIDIPDNHRSDWIDEMIE
jgi:hypothetical protein